LGLLPSKYSPHIVHCLVRLGTCLPFAQVPALAQVLLGIAVSAETVRRVTEAAGAAQVAVAEQALVVLEREAPLPPPGPAVQQVSADGAMVPLVGGVWAEARTVAVGTVAAGHTREMTYFSRLCDARTFIRQVTLPLHERGTERAGVVCAVLDGARWLQELVDYHRPDAVRILDFPHAVEHLAAAGQACWGPGTLAATTWLEDQRHALRHGDSAQVLDAVLALPTPTSEAATVRAQVHAYLASRQDQLAYASFAALGYPLGSGAVESANKLVVEARLKGSGMHWSPKQVNPLLALRGLQCSGQWDAAWPALTTQWRRQTTRAPRHPPQRRQRAPAPSAPVPAGPTPAPPPPRPKTIVAGRPTADHPWRRAKRFPKS
jgi:hypothetical protein